MRFLLLVVLCTALWATEHNLGAQAKSPGRSLAERKQRALHQDLRRGSRGLKKGGGKKSVFDPARRGGDTAFRTASRKREKGSRSPPTGPTFPVPPVSSPVASPTSSTFTGDSFFQTSSKGKGSKGKGGKGSGSRGKGKGGGSGGGRRGGESSKKGKKNRGDICNRFEFQFDRRHLQFEGASCQNNVFDMVSSMGNLSIFAELLEASGISQIFSCGGPFTVLAPTDDAFDGVDVSALSRQSIEDFLYSHIVPGVLLEADFGIGTIESLAGNHIAVHAPLSFNSANALQTDIVGCNGVLFLTDSLVKNFGKCSTLCCRDVFTQLACDPDDELDRCGLVGGDIGFAGNLNNNGISCSPNILEELRQSSEFSLTFGLLERAGLTGILNCGIDLTFIVPSNDAVNALDAELLEFLLLPENIDVLRLTLLYHILPGRHLSSNLTPGPLDTAAFGFSVDVGTSPTSFDGIVPTSSDREYCNGVIHVVDTVIVPGLANDVDDVCAAYDFGGDSNIGNGGNVTPCSPNLLDQARNNTDLQFVVQLIDFVGLADIFDCAGPFTGLLPSNDAIEALGQNLVQDLTRPENISQLREILLYHILPGNFSSADFQNGTLDTLATSAADVIVQVNSTSNSVAFDSSVLLLPDAVQSCNGVAHVVGAVLFPRITAPMDSDAGPTATVRFERFYMSYVTTSSVVPTDAQYEALVAATQRYYEDFFASQIPGFVSLSMPIDFTLSGAAVTQPDSSYNLYIEFGDVEAGFTRDQANPSGAEMTSRMTDGLTADFLLDVVRQIANSPFTSVVQGWVAFASSASPLP